jgi:hypothetical protein
MTNVQFVRHFILDGCKRLIAEGKILPGHLVNEMTTMMVEYEKSESPKLFEDIKARLDIIQSLKSSEVNKDLARQVTKMTILIILTQISKKAVDKDSKYWPYINRLLENVQNANPELRHCPSALLQHYNEGLANDGVVTEHTHHLIAFVRDMFKDTLMNMTAELGLSQNNFSLDTKAASTPPVLYRYVRPNFSF